MLLYVHRDHQDCRVREEPRTATSTFTQLLDAVVLYIYIYVKVQTEIRKDFRFYR